MRFSCDSCQARYSIPDEKVRGRTLKVRCKKCGSVISVREEKKASSGEVEHTRAISPEEMDQLRADTRAAGEEWYLMVEGAQQGPLDRKALQLRVADGSLGLKSFVWREGMADWKRAEHLLELRGLFASSQPPSPVARTKGSAAPTKNEPPVGQPAGVGLESELFSGVNEDPFERVRASSPQLTSDQPGEMTRFFMAQAGVNKRNPPWKVAFFVLALVGLPVSVLYGLSAANVVDLKVTTTDSQGNQVQAPIFSADGLKNLTGLLQLRKANSAAAPRPRPTVAKKEETVVTGHIEQKRLALKASDLEAAKRLYAEEGIGSHAPAISQPKGGPAVEGAGLKGEVIAETVGKAQPAFQACIENELRRNPAFKGGKVQIIATVAPSGIVTRAAIDRREIDQAPVGGCLKDRARRIVFPSFEGEPFDVEIPLVLSKAL